MSDGVDYEPERDEEVRYTVKMRRQLREDAKRKSEHGELADDVRNLFRRRAYGAGGVETNSELQRTKEELQSIRERIDELRRKRGQIDNEIQSQEARANRLEERIESLEEDKDLLDEKVGFVENMLLDGDRMWPVRIKNAVGVNEDIANEIYHELKQKNQDLPEEAFEEPAVHAPVKWTDAVD